MSYLVKEDVSIWGDHMLLSCNFHFAVVKIVPLVVRTVLAYGCMGRINGDGCHMDDSDE